MTEDRRQRTEFRIADFETGNPPEGWESEGQFRNAQLSHCDLIDFL
jgi:hypothetical protein